jgi:hypothetical protein
MFRQALWDEPIIFNLGRAGRIGHILPKVEEEVKKAVGNLYDLIPEKMQRKNAPLHFRNFRSQRLSVILLGCLR